MESGSLVVITLCRRGVAIKALLTSPAPTNQFLIPATDKRRFSPSELGVGELIPKTRAESDPLLMSLRTILARVRKQARESGQASWPATNARVSQQQTRESAGNKRASQAKKKTIRESPARKRPKEAEHPPENDQKRQSTLLTQRASARWPVGPLARCPFSWVLYSVESGTRILEDPEPGFFGWKAIFSVWGSFFFYFYFLHSVLWDYQIFVFSTADFWFAISFTVSFIQGSLGGNPFIRSFLRPQMHFFFFVFVTSDFFLKNGRIQYSGIDVTGLIFFGVVDVGCIFWRRLGSVSAVFGPKDRHMSLMVEVVFFCIGWSGECSGWFEGFGWFHCCVWFMGQVDLLDVKRRFCVWQLCSVSSIGSFLSFFILFFKSWWSQVTMDPKFARKRFYFELILFVGRLYRARQACVHPRHWIFCRFELS